MKIGHTLSFVASAGHKQPKGASGLNQFRNCCADQRLANLNYIYKCTSPEDLCIGAPHILCKLSVLYGFREQGHDDPEACVLLPGLRKKP